MRVRMGTEPGHWRSNIVPLIENQRKWLISRLFNVDFLRFAGNSFLSWRFVTVSLVFHGA
jgi:hypothetical protein